MRKGLRLTDILVTVVISIIFGVVYKLWSPFYYAVKPLGLHIDQLIYGMWFIAAIVAFLLIRKPGVALLAEIASASGEFITGSEWGLEVLLYGVIQGLLAELVFALFSYKNYSMLVSIIASIFSAIGSLMMDLLKGHIHDLAPWNLGLLIEGRILGAAIIAGIFAYYIVKALEQTGVTSLLRPISQKEYDALK